MVETNGTVVSAKQKTVDDRKQIAALDAQFFREDAMRRVESLSQFAQSAWKGLMIVNGGAIVALFTLIGGGHAEPDPAKLWWAFGAFVLGLGGTLGSNIAAYLCQSAYLRLSASSAWNAQEIMHDGSPRWDEEKEHRSGSIWEVVSLAGAGLGLGCFLLGAWLALDAGLAGGFRCTENPKVDVGLVHAPDARVRPTLPEPKTQF